ncbi:MAG: UDP-N-acetylmuramoyl-L-alanine--D-glutamate ligase, partial [Candidatus Margulisiibacteriota bacterium]
MEIETLADKKICILGLGKSGLACVKKLSGLGASLMASESKSPDKIPQGTAEFLKTLEIPLETGGHTDKFLCESDLIVASPGVYLDIEAVEKAREKGIQIISEVELAFSFFTKPVIAVTGTNGKTTTTTLIGEILKNEGYKTVVAGNIGLPLISVDDTDFDYIVAEISSYQLEGIDKFRPRVSLILNLTRDHLERYKGMERYGQAKARIFMNQTKQDFLVFNGEDPLIAPLIKDAVCQKIQFSLKRASEKGAFVNSGYICRLDENYVEAICAVSDLRIKGEHNIENCLAAASACL